jgi:hypothetical protein
MSCQTCGRPERVLLTSGSLPKMPTVERGDFIALDECPTCSALWCLTPHGPYYDLFATWWPYDAPTWRRVHDLDRGKSLSEWHDAVIRESWELLPDSGKADIRTWCDHTYNGNNPIDQGPSFTPPEKILRMSDLDRLVSSLRR